MPVWLVTGASRGLGLGLVKEIASSKNNLVFAACREPGNAKQLEELVASNEDRIHLVKLDVTDESSIKEAASEVGAVLAQKGLTLDFLINNAGITSGNDSPLTLKPENFVNTLLTNAVAPMIVSQHFMPLVDKSKKPVVVNMSSSLGSLEMASGTYQTSYCTSKAALNMLTKRLAQERPDVISFVMDPGWVRTDLGGPSANFDVNFSVSNMYRTISNVSSKHSGAFLRYDGQVMPW